MNDKRDDGFRIFFFLSRESFLKPLPDKASRSLHCWILDLTGKVSLQTECFGLKKDLEEQVVEFNELHSKTVRLSEQLNQVQKDSLPIFTLSVLANLMTGIGINLLTSNSQQWIGGLFIIASVVILIIIYQKTLK